jgi:hypothetical protein
LPAAPACRIGRVDHDIRNREGDGAREADLLLVHHLVEGRIERAPAGPADGTADGQQRRPGMRRREGRKRGRPEKLSLIHVAPRRWQKCILRQRVI